MPTPEETEARGLDDNARGLPSAPTGSRQTGGALAADRLGGTHPKRSSPTRAAASPVSRGSEGEPLVSVYFDTDSFALRPDAITALVAPMAAVQAALLRQPVALRFIGFADHRGTEAHNLRLGQQRADAVARHFSALRASRNCSWSASSAGESGSDQLATRAQDLQRERRVDIVARPNVFERSAQSALGPQPKNNAPRDPNGGRLAKSLGLEPFTEGDEAGRLIVKRWLGDDGSDWVIRDDPDWAEYMMADTSLTRQVGDYVRGLALSLHAGRSLDLKPIADYQPREDGLSFTLRDKRNIAIIGSESPIGTQLLHGTEASVGGFQIEGPVDVEKTEASTTVKLSLRFTWNDKIDARWAASLKDAGGKVLELAYVATPYTIRISWRSEISLTFRKNQSHLTAATGWPFE